MKRPYWIACFIIIWSFLFMDKAVPIQNEYVWRLRALSLRESSRVLFGRGEVAERPAGLPTIPTREEYRNLLTTLYTSLSPKTEITPEVAVKVADLLIRLNARQFNGVRIARDAVLREVYKTLRGERLPPDEKELLHLAGYLAERRRVILEYVAAEIKETIVVLKKLRQSTIREILIAI